MAILSLPNELLLAIGEQQCLTRTDHWSLVLVSKSFSTIFMRVLYKEVRLKFPQRDLIPDSCPLSSFALGDPILQAILERLDSNPRLKACVRKCQIDNLICWNRPYSPTTDNRCLEWMLDPLFTLIGQLIHLKSICLYHSSIPAEWMLYLARQPSLKLIELSDTDVYNEPSHDGSFNIVALSSSGRSFDFFIRTLTFSGALVQLCLPNIPLQALTIAYSSSKGPILKALKSFAIGVFGTEGFRFFACTPNLTRLEFMDKFKHPYIPQYVGEWGKVLPKLETIRCQSILLSLFTRGRPVTSISVDQGNFYGILAMPKYFGSDVPVRKFHAEFCDDVPQLLAYIVANNSEIEELAVLYRKLSHTSYMRNVVANWFPLLKRLTCLQILQLQYKVDQENWDYYIISLVLYHEEQNACKELRAEGCPNIAKVCFNPETIWSFSQNRGLWEKEEWSKRTPLVLVEV